MPIARLQTGAGDVAGVCPPPQLAGENRLATPVECADDKAYEANYVRGGRDGVVGERGGGRRGKGTGRKRETVGQEHTWIPESSPFRMRRRMCSALVGLGL